MDKTLSVVITGSTGAVDKAKTKLLSKLQKQAEIKLEIPPEHHRTIIGRGGETLKQIQEQTCTRVRVPNSDSGDSFIVSHILPIPFLLPLSVGTCASR